MSFSAAQLRAVLESITPHGTSGLVVALSGGADSASLLMAAAAHAPFRGLPLRAVHINHGLQAAAAQFTESCAALCRRLQVPFTVISVRVDARSGASLEAAARDARYAALAAQLRPRECLLTAHHALDQAETLLLQSLRGAGLAGMSAMPLCRSLGLGWHLRPLLHVPQSDLLAFGASAAAAASVPDPMNSDLRFDRNYLRARIWPLIEARWPGAEISLSRTARHVADAQESLDRAAASDVARLSDGDALQVPGLRALSPNERINAVRYWICEAGVSPPTTARLHEALRQVFAAGADRLPMIAWDGHALRRYQQRLFLTDADPPRLEGERRLIAEPGSRIDLGPRLGNLLLVARTGGIQAARLPDSLTVRARAGGETLKPSPQGRTQSLKHLCQSQGVLPWMRDALPLVFAQDALISVADLWTESRWCAAGAPGLVCVWEHAPVIV